MISLEQARDRILGHLQPLPAESIPLRDALHHLTAGPHAAILSAPPFDNSAFDGYALRAEDLQGQDPEQPRPLRVTGCTPAGSAPGPGLTPGTCSRIFTGAPLPPGADAVLMQEDAFEFPGQPGCIGTRLPPRPWEGVRFAGEDFKAGTPLLTAGTRLGPAQLALLAAAGHATASVHPWPRLYTLSSGSELVDPGFPPGPGQIPDSNAVMLEGLARSGPSRWVGSARVDDSMEATLAALQHAAGVADVVVTAGGVSVGTADLLRPAIERLGGQVDLWKVSMKPGKPFAFGRLGTAWWFGLPGNPVSAFVTWWKLVRPALLLLAGADPLTAKTSQGRLQTPLRNPGDRTHFLRVRISPDGSIVASGPQASHHQAGLAVANALLEMPPKSSWPAGHEARVELLD